MSLSCFLKSGTLLALGLLLIQCKTISVNDRSLHRTDQAVELGVICIQDENLVDNQLRITAIPKLLEPVRLSIATTDMNKDTYEYYFKAYSNDPLQLTLSDTVAVSPKLIYLNFSDPLSLIDQLNAPSNTSSKTYLKTQSSARLVSSIALAVGGSEAADFLEADSYFLINREMQKMKVLLYKEDVLLKEFSFDKGAVLGYSLAEFCWGPVRGEDVEIREIVPAGKACPRKTEKKAEKAREKFNPYKF